MHPITAETTRISTGVTKVPVYLGGRKNRHLSCIITPQQRMQERHSNLYASTQVKIGRVNGYLHRRNVVILTEKSSWLSELAQPGGDVISLENLDVPGHCLSDALLNRM